MTDNYVDIASHYNEDLFNARQEELLLHVLIIQHIKNGKKSGEIAKHLNTPRAKVQRLKKQYFPTLPTRKRDGSATKRKNIKRKEAWSELNARDRRIVRMLQTQSYKTVAEKNNVSIGTIYNIAHYYADQLRERKVIRKSRKRAMVENDK